MRKVYAPPTIMSEDAFEGSALACGKTADPPPGSHHWYGAYDTFTGHFCWGVEAVGWGEESATGSIGIGYGPGGTSTSYAYSGLCINWVTLST